MHSLTKALMPFIANIESHVTVRMVAVMAQAAGGPPGKRCVSGIADDLNIPRSTVSIIVTRLIELGLVKQRVRYARLGQDARCGGSGEPISLTDEGLALLSGC